MCFVSTRLARVGIPPENIKTRSVSCPKMCWNRWSRLTKYPWGVYKQRRFPAILYPPARLSGGMNKSICRLEYTGVTGQNIPQPEYTLVYYGLGQFIPLGIFWPRPIHTTSGHNRTVI